MINFLKKPEIPEVIVVTPQVHPDGRGHFLETYHSDKYDAYDINGPFVQDNQSQSQMGTLRGLHAQIKQPQGKLVRCVSGIIFDVAVDIRVGSPTYTYWTGEILTGENFKQLWIPPGFLHGFYVMSYTATVSYKCTTLYRPKDEIGVIWDDPTIGIEWSDSTRCARIGPPILSRRDASHPTLEAQKHLLPKYIG